MRINFPIGLLAIVICLYLFYEYNRVRKAKREERRDKLNEHRQELLNNVLNAKKKSDDNPSEV